MNRSARKISQWFLACAALSACKHEKSGDENIGTVKRDDIVQRVTVNGRIAPFKKSLISAPYVGYVQKLFVKIGDHVKEGDPVVSLRPDIRTVGEEVFPLRAPLAGTVTQILKLEGDAVEATGDARGLVRIDDLSHLSALSNVPEVDVEKMHVGQEGLVKASAILDHTYKGSVRSISLAAKQEGNRWDSSGVEFPVIVDILDKDDNLKPGMSVLVDIISKKVTNVLSLRLEFIEKSGDGQYVTLENGEKRKIEVGMQNEEAAEIRSGLKEGDRVRQVDFLKLGDGN